jgi:hypothetical protein
MNQPEKRRLPRRSVGAIPFGALVLVCNGEHIPIEQLRDLSDSGISFSLRRPLVSSEKISVKYSDPKVALEVFGRVAWCSPASDESANATPPGQYFIGVELLSPSLLYSALPKP